MRDRALEDMLRRTLRQEVPPARLEETVRLCRDLAASQPVLPAGARAGFWSFLSDVFHFEGLPILLSQLGVLFFTCLVAGSSPMSSYELPMYMPLFILTVSPVFFRGQRHRVSELEAATRTSGPQLALARLVLAGGSALLCVTLLLALEVYLQRSCENLGRMVLYCLVPYLICMTAMLALIRRRKKDSAPICVLVSLGSVAFWRCSAFLFPWLYEASALGVWLVGVLVYAWLFAKEIAFILQARRKIDMYGIAG